MEKFSIFIEMILTKNLEDLIINHNQFLWRSKWIFCYKWNQYIKLNFFFLVFFLRGVKSKFEKKDSFKVMTNLFYSFRTNSLGCIQKNGKLSNSGWETAKSKWDLWMDKVMWRLGIENQSAKNRNQNDSASLLFSSFFSFLLYFFLLLLLNVFPFGVLITLYLTPPQPPIPNPNSFFEKSVNATTKIFYITWPK